MPLLRGTRTLGVNPEVILKIRNLKVAVFHQCEEEARAHIAKQLINDATIGNEAHASIEEHRLSEESEIDRLAGIHRASRL